MTILTKIPETINVVSKDLKKNTPALVKKHTEGYTIVLNARYSHDRLQEALKHELKHIEEQHFHLPTADHAEKQVRSIPIKNEPTFYLMYEALAIGAYLKEQEELRRTRRAPQAKREVDAWIEELKKKEQKLTKQTRTEHTPGWVIDARRKLGLALPH